VSNPRLLILATLGILLAACSSSTSTSTSSSESSSHRSSSSITDCCAPSRPDARVVGSLVGIGGPVGTAVQHWTGTIHIGSTGSTTLQTDDRGRFSAHLKPGTYRFTATSPSYDDGTAECRASGPVRLRAHEITHVRVICQLK
jgi:hypothetical protein